MDSSPEFNPQLEGFRHEVEQGFEGFLESLEILGDTPIPPDPFAMLEGDERTMEDLSPDEQMVIWDVMFNELGLHEPGERQVRQYVSVAPDEATVPGDIKVTVLSTNREGVYVHEMVFPDSKTRWAIGPDIDI